MCQVMFQLMTVSPKIVSPQNSSPLRLSSDNAGIEFDGVSFQYQPGQPILQNLSFSVALGQSIAIVGGLSSVKTEIRKYFYFIQGRDPASQQLQDFSTDSLSRRRGTSGWDS